MSSALVEREKKLAEPMDWLDIGFAVFVGALFVPMKAIELLYGNPGNIGGSLGGTGSIICLAYIFWRANRQPEKLREWGITAPITGMAIVVFVGLMSLTAFVLAATSLSQGGAPTFEFGYIFRMIDYVSGAFPQQFLFFAVGIVNLEKLSFLRGNWRLPLLMGVTFAAGHLFDIKYIWGIPTAILVTLPMGFGVTYYFLRFRTIIPIVAFHAIGFVLLTNWVEKHL